jgi:hypothetical protein
MWFFSLVNFLAREVQRRRPFPWDEYMPHSDGVWKSVLSPHYDAPSLRAPTHREVKKRRAMKRKETYSSTRSGSGRS